MNASFKFVKVQNRLGYFAQIGLESTLSYAFSVVWTKDVAQYERFYVDAVREGIEQALRWHRDLGGGLAKFTILEFSQTIADTNEDAVRCASAAAAWKSLGHSEAELSFDFDGIWHVRRSE